MASEMAKHINENVGHQYAFSDLEIQIIRIAGMLHDIGHYPMSHNIELAYKMRSYDKKEATKSVKDNLKDLIGCPPYLYPKDIEDSREREKYWKSIDYSEHDYSGSKDYHHEAVGQQIIVSNQSIHDIVRDYFVTYKKNDQYFVYKEFIPSGKYVSDDCCYTKEDVDDYTTSLINMIGAVIVGSYEFGISAQDEQFYPFMNKYSAMVQILHSELDADNIDYLLRDSLFSGTSYGYMDVSFLLNSLTMAPFLHKTYSMPDDKELTDFLVGILPKGVGCVDQFFQNKYLAYTQMIMNKYVSSLEFMLLRWARDELTRKKDYGIKGVGECSSRADGLLEMIKESDTDSRFIGFTDSYIVNELFSQYDYMKSSSDTLIKIILSRLTNYHAFDLDRPEKGEDTSDILCVEFGEKAIADRINGTEIYQELCSVLSAINDKKICEISNRDEEKMLYSYRFEEYRMTKQLPYGDFFRYVFLNKDDELKDMDEKRVFQNHFFRLVNGIPILTKNEYKFDLKPIKKNCKECYYDAKDSIPNLIVDYTGSFLHNTYQQIAVFLRKYKVVPYSCMM